MASATVQETLLHHANVTQEFGSVQDSPSDSTVKDVHRYDGSTLRFYNTVTNVIAIGALVLFLDIQ